MSGFETEKSGISRRTVVKGTAWAVPAVVAASATPAFAASQDGPKFGDHCKHSGGGSGNVFRFYVMQPTEVGDRIVIDGDAVEPGTSISNEGCGVTLIADPDRESTDTVKYFLVATVDTSKARPYIVVAGTDADANTEVRITQISGDTVQEKGFASNTNTCSSAGWKGCS